MGWNANALLLLLAIGLFSVCGAFHGIIHEVVDGAGRIVHGAVPIVRGAIHGAVRGAAQGADHGTNYQHHAHYVPAPKEYEHKVWPTAEPEPCPSTKLADTTPDEGEASCEEGVESHEDHSEYENEEEECDESDESHGREDYEREHDNEEEECEESNEDHGGEGYEHGSVEDDDEECEESHESQRHGNHVFPAIREAYKRGHKKLESSDEERDESQEDDCNDTYEDDN